LSARPAKLGLCLIWQDYFRKKNYT